MRYKILGFRELGIGNRQESKMYLTSTRIAILKNPDTVSILKIFLTDLLNCSVNVLGVNHKI